MKDLDWLERLDRLEDKLSDKLDKVLDRLGDVDIILVRQNDVLEDHTRRSLANEAGLDILREEMSTRRPKKTNHRALVAKVAAAVAAAATVVSAVLKALGKI